MGLLASDGRHDVAVRRHALFGEGYLALLVDYVHRTLDALAVLFKRVIRLGSSPILVYE